MLKNDFDVFISIVKAGISGEKLNIPEEFNINKLYSFARAQQVMGLVFYGALAAGIDTNTEVMQKLYIGTISELTIHEKQMEELKKISSIFTNNQISFMPLKGSSIKKLYSRPETRIMSDLDILIKLEEYEKIQKLLIEQGYEKKYESNHEIVWKKNNGTLIELHKRLIATYNSDYYRYFGDGWLRAETTNNDFCYAFKPEDEFIYIFTHFAKHYRGGGIGIRQFCDLWVYLKSYNLNIDYIEKELKELGLLEFYKNVLVTLSVWFESAKPNKATNIISQTILTSFSFGTKETRTSAMVVRRSNGKKLGKVRTKLIMIKTKVFPPKEFIVAKYPYLQTKPWLLPIAWVSRLLTVLFFKRDRIKYGMKTIKNTNYQLASEFEQNLKKVGLTFDFKE